MHCFFCQALSTYQLWTGFVVAIVTFSAPVFKFLWMEGCWHFVLIMRPALQWGFFLRVPVLLSVISWSCIRDLQMDISPCSCSSQAAGCCWLLFGKGSWWRLVGFLGSPDLASVLGGPHSPTFWGWSFLSVSDLCPHYNAPLPVFFPSPIISQPDFALYVSGRGFEEWVGTCDLSSPVIVGLCFVSPLVAWA